MKNPPKYVFRKILVGISFFIFLQRTGRLLRKSANRKRIFFAGTPLHGNLGDHAIAIAMRRFFEKFFPNAKVVEIPGKFIEKISKYAPGFFRGKTKPDDVLAIIGGGFLGTLWMNEEKMVRSALRLFPQTRTVIFPQTVFFENTPQGKIEQETTKKIWTEHGNLHVFIRDRSIDLLREKIVAKNTFGVPDIVLSLDRSEPKFERAGVLLCFRADKEKTLPDEAIFALEKNLRSRGESVSRTDTVVPYGVPADAREFEVERKFDEFRRARLVITDRLHGMIFAAITGTPCIALNNSSGKVEGVWSLWLRHLPYVKFVRDAAEISPLVSEMLALGGRRYDASVFEKYWEQIAETMKGTSRR